MSHYHLFDDLQPGDRLVVTWKAIGEVREVAGTLLGIVLSNKRRYCLRLRLRRCGIWSIPTEQILDMKKVEVAC